MIEIDNYFRKIFDINGNIVDYEIYTHKILKLVEEIEKQNFILEKLTERKMK